MGLAAAVGCGSEAVGKLQLPLTSDEGRVTLLTCADLLLATHPIEPAAELDYIGVYQQFWSNRPDYITVVSDHGEVCHGAKDQGACIADVVAHLADPPSCTTGDVQCQPFVITTHGSEVRRYSNPDELADMLGSVDTPSEAALIAQLYGLHLECNGVATGARKASVGTLVQETDTGWRVQSQWSACGDRDGDQAIEIRKDGTSEGLTRNVIALACTTTGG